MASSGAASFVPSFDDILTEAWERLGLSAAIITGDVVRAARRSMQLMLIDWSNRNASLWQIDREDAVLTAGVGLYPAPAESVDVLEVWINWNGSDLRLWPVARDEFSGIPNKLQTGRPTQYWVERRRDLPVIHLWPVPDRDYTLSVNRLRLPEDVGTLMQSPDTPVLWSEALAAGLAARLAVKFKPDRVTLLKVEASEAWANANGEERERVALVVQPDVRNYW